MTASSKPPAKVSPHSRFIPREEIAAAVAWSFSSMDAALSQPAPLPEAEPEPASRAEIDQLLQDARQQAYAEGFQHGHDAGSQETRDALEAVIRRSAEETAVRMGQLLHSMGDQLIAAEPGAKVIERDLVGEPLDHLTLAAFADSAVLDEFLAAETVVVGAPMYNFNISSQLKSWIDRIAVAGKTFRYTAEGPQGLAGGKQVIVAATYGGMHPADSGRNFVEPYLRQVFGFFGIDDVEFVSAEALNVSPEQRTQALESAQAAIDALPARAA